MLSTGHSVLHNPHPIQALGFFRYGKESTPLFRGRSDRARHPTGHASMQMPQAMQLLITICGFGHCDRFIMVHKTPCVSITADWGHVLPQAPHSMHKSASMECSFFFSPEMASAGHTRLQAPQPLH
jgi:hypothetical protein